jgi:hypothetical protein
VPGLHRRSAPVVEIQPICLVPRLRSWKSCYHRQDRLSAF